MLDRSVSETGVSNILIYIKDHICQYLSSIYPFYYLLCAKTIPLPSRIFRYNWTSMARSEMSTLGRRLKWPVSSRL